MTNPNVPAPDRLFSPDNHEKEKDNWIQKQDRRNEVKSVIAFTLMGAAVVAFLYILPHVINPALFSNIDAIIAIGAFFAFVGGMVMRIMANYCDNPHVGGGEFWWMQ